MTLFSLLKVELHHPADKLRFTERFVANAVDEHKLKCTNSNAHATFGAKQYEYDWNPFDFLPSIQIIVNSKSAFIWVLII